MKKYGINCLLSLSVHTYNNNCNISTAPIYLIIQTGRAIGVWSCFQIVGAASVKAHLSKLSLVLGINSCLEMDNLRVLEI